MTPSSLWTRLIRKVSCWLIARKANRLLIDIACCNEWANEIERHLEEGLPSDVAREAQAELIETRERWALLKEQLSEVWVQRAQCMERASGSASSSNEPHKGG